MPATVIDAPAPFLQMRQARYRYPDTTDTIGAIDLQVPAGAFHCLLGRSGCGKSTLLKLAAGLILPSAGTVSVNGQPVNGPGPDTGFVFQAPTLLEWLDVLDNVLLPIALKQRPDAAQIEHARALLAQLGMSQLQHRSPLQLSGGQQSRVAIARALVTRPRLLLMDEPFAALDAMTREALQDTLLAICQQQRISTLFVTHDIGEAAYLADCVSIMEHGHIHTEQAIPLPRPRDASLRQSAAFSAVCAELRQRMEQVA